MQKIRFFTKIVPLSGCSWTRTQNHIVRKRTLNHLAKLAESGFTLKRVHDMARTYSHSTFTQGNSVRVVIKIF